MSVLIAENVVENYFKIINNWDFESKNSLILKLNNSLNKKSHFSPEFSKLFGGWNDNRNAEDIIIEIESSRVNQKELEVM
ncbi:MAG: hypothetical protein KIT33_04925 [Candidatus Kapabacteria bacterium]|nr:hypothetical protein [Ignavibacteriota bacterium]MCW5884299.1 hypothetical protein [Candidatus Kapabacteria bacterium]